MPAMANLLENVELTIDSLLETEAFYLHI